MTAKRRDTATSRRRTRGPSSANWALGRRSAPFVVEKPQPFRPDLLVLLDVGADWMVAMEAIEPRLAADSVAEWAAGRLETGVTVRVDAEDVAAALRARVGSGIDVVVAPTPEVDAALDSFEEHSAQASAGRSRDHEWADDVPEAAKLGFYAAAAAFEHSEPWQVASDGHVLAIDVPAVGWAGACTAVMGMAGESFGLTLFRSLGDYVRFVRLGDDPTARRRPGSGVALLGIHFDRPRYLPGGRKLREEARAHGFVPGPEGRYPFILKTSPENVRVGTTSDDYRLATACLVAVRQFVERQQKLFTEPPDQRVSARSRVAMPAGELEITVTAPPADVPWRWGSEEPIEGLRRRDREEVLVAYREAREAAGASPADVDADGWAAEEMLEFKQGIGPSLVDWTTDDVSDFLLEYYPPHGLTTGAETEALPGRFDTFFTWLSSSGRGPKGRLSVARARLAERRAAFLAAAGDETRFGPAKLMGARMQAEGIDPADEKAVRAFIGRFNERLAEDPTLLPSLGKPRAKRWVWDGKGVPPEPNAPCPCGSGRRYRKCCRPR